MDQKKQKKKEKPPVEYVRGRRVEYVDPMEKTFVPKNSVATKSKDR
jgi:hypothetical protein